MKQSVGFLPVEKTVKQVVTFLSLVALVCFFLSPLRSAAAATGKDARATRQEIERLLEEAPTLSSYPGQNALVLSRQLTVRLLADGSMEKHTLWLVTYRGRMPAGWENWKLPAPDGGKSSIVSAKLFSMPGAGSSRSLEVVPISGEGVPGDSVRIPEVEKDSMLLVETVEQFPRRFDLDDQIQVRLELPQWEFRVEVETPRGAGLKWAGSGIGQPEIRKDAAVDRYVWSAKNIPGKGNLLLLDEGVSVLAFSLKEGLKPSLEGLRELARRPLPLPEALGPLLSGRDPVKSGMRLLERLNKDKSGDFALPGNWVREAKDPGFRNGPWTDWESILIAYSGLKSLGWKAEVWWLPSVPVGGNMPAGNSLWAYPVIEASPQGGKPFLFVLGSAVEPSRTPSVLIGATLYRLEGEVLQTKKIPAGSPSANRFSVSWELGVDDTGFVSGKLSILLRGGWETLVRSSADLSPERAEGLARTMLASTPFLSGMGTPELSESGGGVKIALPVSGLLGISSQKDLLVRFPAVELPGLKEILEANGAPSFRFPFSIRQEFSLKLPPGYRLLEAPVLRGKDGGVAKLEETFRNREGKGVIEASQTFSVTALSPDKNGMASLEEIIPSVMRWGANTIPLRKR